MSQLHHLELTSAAGPIDHVAQVLPEVATGAGLVASVSPAPSGDPVDAVLTLRSGLRASVSLPFVSRGPDPFIADLGLERATTVDLQANATTPAGPQIDEMLHLVFLLLARLPGDAALHTDYAEVWLVRHATHLTLSENPDLWRPTRLAQVPTPYNRAPLKLS